MAPSTPWYILMGATALFTVATLIFISLFKFYRAELDKADDRFTRTHNKYRRALTALETIRDMGPSGADPLPPCRFCKQGPGHWAAPEHKDCPSVFARNAIFSMERPPGVSEEAERQAAEKLADWWRKHHTFG